MSILAIILAAVAAVGWLATLGTLIYGLVTAHRFAEGMFMALIIVTLVAAGAFTGAAELLGYE
ncbi:hypothetical protein [Corynebacterium guaraldiae]|uniref:hypothetical protein n=1 Tax=Corynebacterium guaraldiae TaxID=3051103 RepID=UPI001178A2BF|nr:hypothetical protein [Corynebacterium guaraldiae]MCG7261194.1 hypothetical protein [Corynebacterium aurimucosum]TRX42504.1 hypothetical protein FNY89_03150 [Corynebacterium guaraldiae]